LKPPIHTFAWFSNDPLQRAPPKSKIEKKSRQPSLPNESKDRFVVLNVNFSVVNLVEATLLTSCPWSKQDWQAW
jgi:hypothetical protein